jgi:hypothetical protein
MRSWVKENTNWQDPDLSKNSPDDANEITKKEKKTVSDLLLEIAKTATYFHNANKIAYADVSIEGSRHTYAVRSRDFKLWLSGEYYKATGKGLDVVSKLR